MFEEILNEQVNNKDTFIKKILKQTNVMNFQIQNNSIKICVYPHNSPMIHRYAANHKMIEDLLESYTIPDIIFNINIADFPVRGMLNFCKDNKSHDQFVCPNHRFSINDISIEKHEAFNIHDDNNDIKDWDDCVKKMKHLYKNDDFETKIPKVFASFKYENTRKHYVDFVLKNRDVADMYIYGGHPVHKFRALNNDKLAKELIEKNLAGTQFKAFGEHSKYKYIMYLDGNTLSDRMRLLLGMGSIIFRFPSKYEEFYSRELKDGVNYILVKDYNELREKVNYLEKNPDICKKIIHNNWNFLESVLSRKNTLEYLARLLIGVA